MKHCSFYWVLSLFVCVVMVLFCNSSTCLAYSFDDFLEYCQLITENSTITDNKNAASWVLRNKTTLQNYVNSIPNLNEYSTWYLYRLNASSTYNGNIGIIAQKKGTSWNWGGKIKSQPYTRLDY